MSSHNLKSFSIADKNAKPNKFLNLVPRVFTRRSSTRWINTVDTQSRGLEYWFGRPNTINPNYTYLSGLRFTMAMLFDDILRQVGDFSRFQHIQWFLLFLTTVTQAWYSYAPAFSAAKVKDEDVICTSSVNISGCNNNCTSFRYAVDFTSIATEVRDYIV